MKCFVADEGEEHREEVGLCVLVNSLPFSTSLALEATVAARSLSKLVVLPKVSAAFQKSRLTEFTLPNKQSSQYCIHVGDKSSLRFCYH